MHKTCIAHHTSVLVDSFVLGSTASKHKAKDKSHKRAINKHKPRSVLPLSVVWKNVFLLQGEIL